MTKEKVTFVGLVFEIVGTYNQIKESSSQIKTSITESLIPALGQFPKLTIETLLKVESLEDRIEKLEGK